MIWFTRDCALCHKRSYTSNPDLKVWCCPYCQDTNIEKDAVLAEKEANVEQTLDTLLQSYEPPKIGEKKTQPGKPVELLHT